MDLKIVSSITYGIFDLHSDQSQRKLAIRQGFGALAPGTGSNEAKRSQASKLIEFNVVSENEAKRSQANFAQYFQILNWKSAQIFRKRQSTGHPVKDWVGLPRALRHWRARKRLWQV
jgi:hypothetical protein